jgi:hypothetical protein
LWAQKFERLTLVTRPGLALVAWVWVTAREDPRARLERGNDEMLERAQEGPVRYHRCRLDTDGPESMHIGGERRRKVCVFSLM